MIELGTKVLTPNGPGTIKDYEVFDNSFRYGVLLDDSMFSWIGLMYYFKDEINILKESKNVSDSNK